MIVTNETILATLATLASFDCVTPEAEGVCDVADVTLGPEPSPLELWLAAAVA